MLTYNNINIFSTSRPLERQPSCFKSCKKQCCTNNFTAIQRQVVFVLLKCGIWEDWGKGPSPDLQQMPGKTTSQQSTANSIDWAPPQLLRVFLRTKVPFVLSTQQTTISSCQSCSTTTVEWVAKDCCCFVRFVNSTENSYLLSSITFCHNCGVDCLGLVSLPIHNKFYLRIHSL